MPPPTELHLAARASRSLLDHSLQHNHGTPCMHLLALRIFATAPFPRPASLDALYILAESENGQIPGMCALASVYRDGVPGALPPSPARAVALWRKAVSAYGCALSTFLLAQAVEFGHGVQPHPALAALLYETALLAEGFGFAAAALARMLEHGAEGVLPDLPRAVRLYEFAVRKGSTEAIVRLARILRDGRVGVVPKGMVCAVERLEEAARDGNSAQAMTALASMLEEGTHGVARDPERAMALYEHAAMEEEDVHAMMSLARMLLEGPVERDVFRAVTLLESALDSGSRLAGVRLAELLSTEDEVRDEPRALALLYELEEDEDYRIQAKTEIAWLLSGRATEVPMDAVKAAELYEEVLRETGEVDIMLILADMLMDGHGELEADPQRSVGLYERAVCDYGSLRAMNRLGRLYSLGVRGVLTRDNGKAIALFERAASKGYFEAKYNLARMLTVGCQAVDLGRGMELFAEMARRYGHLWSMINLAKCLVPSDEDEVGEEEGRRAVQRAVGLLEQAIRIGVQYSESELRAVGISRRAQGEADSEAGGDAGSCSGGAGTDEDENEDENEKEDGEAGADEDDDVDDVDEEELELTERLREVGIAKGAHIAAMVTLSEILTLHSSPREPEKALRLLERAVAEVEVPHALEKVTVNYMSLWALAQATRGTRTTCARVGRVCKELVTRSGRGGGEWVVGEMVRRGWGTRACAAEAAHWLERGACRGDGRASVALAEMVQAGEGVAAAPHRAVALATAALSTGGGSGGAGADAEVSRRAVLVLVRAWAGRRDGGGGG